MRKEELADIRTQVITELIHPLNSVLDDSIGCALWFAARGKGCLEGQPFLSPARVRTFDYLHCLWMFYYMLCFTPEEVMAYKVGN